MVYYDGQRFVRFTFGPYARFEDLDGDGTIEVTESSYFRLAGLCSACTPVLRQVSCISTPPLAFENCTLMFPEAAGLDTGSAPITGNDDYAKGAAIKAYASNLLVMADDNAWNATLGRLETLHLVEWLGEFRTAARSWAEGLAAPGADETAASFLNRFREIDTRPLTTTDLETLTPSELGFLRNYIYARHGRPFVTEKYRDYFAQFGWYRVDPNYSDDVLNAIERQNVATIAKRERELLVD